MVFVETPIFTKLVRDLLPDDDYRVLQQALVLRPEAGHHSRERRPPQNEDLTLKQLKTLRNLVKEWLQ